MADIKVNPWVADYVKQLFINRGWNPEADEDVALVIANQWEHWKRLMVQTGLNADGPLAEDLAYGFALKEIRGGPGRVLEVFAKYVQGRPKEVLEKEYVRQTTEEKENCETCNGSGLIYLKVSRRRPYDNPEIVEERYRCSCRNGLKYQFMRAPSQTQLQEALRQSRMELDQAYHWCREHGIDPDGTVEEKATQWRQWFTRNYGNYATSSNK